MNTYLKNLIKVFIKIKFKFSVKGYALHRHTYLHCIIVEMLRKCINHNTNYQNEVNMII